MLDGKLKCWEPSAGDAVEKTLRTVRAKRETRTVFIGEKLYQRMDMDTTERKGGLRLPYYVWIWKVWSTSGVTLCSPTVL